MKKLDVKEGDFSGGYKTPRYFNGIPIKVDPNAPPNMIYFMNDKYMEFSVLDHRTRWQRIKDWFKSKLGIK